MLLERKHVPEFEQFLKEIDFSNKLKVFLTQQVIVVSDAMIKSNHKVAHVASVVMGV